ncbi:unnamed protein product [Lymnaea stagnalis]|uniref:C2H2-type domain-containing protein n=1 Tax=Lymnaea stagnalis TaxID=6523 RepID=A0AAV2IQ01_LYMST
MPELHLDIAVANRFISSLSKSLQALCHGCMDFDSGIEIVGYININIDSGSKVDYVLNEKVLKSTNNSMTFVSNSFLAKKEQPKQTRDGACSPITGLAPYSTPSYHSRTWGSHLGSQHHRPSSQFAHSQVLHGAQKRQWAGDWRASQKKHRPISTSGEGLSNSQSSSHTYTDSFKQPQLPNLGSITDNTGDSESQLIKIKKEALETDNDSSALPEADFSTAQDQSIEDQTSDSQTNIKIKNDPDATHSNDSEINPDDGNQEKKGTDFQGTFLEPSSDNQDVPDEQSSDQSVLRQTTPLRITSETSNSGGDFADEQSKASTSAVDTCEADDTAHEDEPSGSDMPLDYDQGNDDMPYPHSVHSDAGEGSSDTGQFEVIEIDDEDEDVQAMFGDPQGKGLRKLKQAKDLAHVGGQSQQLLEPETQPYLEMFSPSYSGLHSISTSSRPCIDMASPGQYEAMIQMFDGVSSHQGKPMSDPNMIMKCPLCDMFLESRIFYQKHMNSEHRQAKYLPYTCKMCFMGFFSLSGLQKHVEAHSGRRFTCELCSAKFTHKHHLKRHWLAVHKTSFCE